MDVSFKWWVRFWPEKKNGKLFVIGSFLELSSFHRYACRVQKYCYKNHMIFGSENNWSLLIRYGIALSSQKDVCLLSLCHWSIFVAHKAKIEKKNFFYHCCIASKFSTERKLHVQKNVIGPTLNCSISFCKYRITS